jgi:nitroreductase
MPGGAVLYSRVMDDTALSAAMELITGRRSNLRIDPGAPVDPGLIRQLCEAAIWAPNHKLTEPWRFAVLTGPARAALGRIGAEALAAEGRTDATRLEKAAAKYQRAPVVLAVGCVGDPDPVRFTENRDAVAAGVQNMLLAATAAGLASFWATGLTARLPGTRRLCGFEADTEIVALIYLGWPVAEPPPPARRAPQVTWVDSAD